MNPRGTKPKALSIGRVGLYVFLVVAAAFVLMPAYVMIVTSLKTMEEIHQGQIFALPARFDLSAWTTAWMSACTGLTCNGISVGFWNSVAITIPSTALSVAVGALNGYALSFWNVRGAKLLFALLMMGAFVPFQIYVYPLVRFVSTIGLYNSLGGIILIHVIFGLPLVTLFFRNFYASLPVELFNAARVDGAGFWRIFRSVILPMSTPMIVVTSIVQMTGIWNDFLFGLIFAGRDHLPMTVQLNNIVNTTTGVKLYNVNMAATLLTALVPMAIFFLSGRWFVRGIAAGAVKG